MQNSKLAIIDISPNMREVNLVIFKIANKNEIIGVEKFNWRISDNHPLTEVANNIIDRLNISKPDQILYDTPRGSMYVGLKEHIENELERNKITTQRLDFI